MGNKGSSYSDSRQSPRSQSSSSWNYYDSSSQAPYSQDSQSSNYPPHRPVVPAYGPPQASYTAPQAGYSVPYPAPQVYSQGSGGHAPAPKKTFDRRYSRIADNYRSLEEVTEALARAGLESSNLIVGKKSFSGKSLHYIGNGSKPYEQGISIIGKTLAVFDQDNLIPCFGFGDATTHDQDVFSFYPDERYCHGFEEVLTRYREIAPNLKPADLNVELENFLCSSAKTMLKLVILLSKTKVPELLFAATAYGPSIDMWSAGCILAELYMGKPIMRGRTE